MMLYKHKEQQSVLYCNVGGIFLFRQEHHGIVFSMQACKQMGR